METSSNPQCRQAPVCKVAVDGKCIEGLDIKVCPHIFITQSGDNSNGDDRSNEPRVKLLSGEELTLSELSVVSNNYPVRRIFIIGESDSGKTTMLIRLYNLFQFGPFHQFQFAGSLTLVGFERRCHLSKTESNGTEEQTEKTKSNEFNFLHFAILNETELGPEKHFVISDISGERIRLARNSSAEMKELGVPLKYSARIIINLDGAKLGNKKLKMSAILDSQTFLRQALDDGVITRKQKVRIVVSKWDLVAGNSDFSFERDIVDVFTSAFKNRIDDLKFFKVAARPTNPIEIEPGHGIKELLEDWCADDTGEIDQSVFEQAPESDRLITKFRAN